MKMKMKLFLVCLIPVSAMASVPSHTVTFNGNVKASTCELVMPATISLPDVAYNELTSVGAAYHQHVKMPVFMQNCLPGDTVNIQPSQVGSQLPGGGQVQANVFTETTTGYTQQGALVATADESGIIDTMVNAAKPTEVMTRIGLRYTPTNQQADVLIGTHSATMTFTVTYS
ncbi:MAG TPA: hypothetical protein VGH05_03850 [Buttiauxella sp.]|jgi:type 1 fimbria pilin